MGMLFFAALAESRELPALLNLLAVVLITVFVAWIFGRLLRDPDEQSTGEQSPNASGWIESQGLRICPYCADSTNDEEAESRSQVGE